MALGFPVLCCALLFLCGLWTRAQNIPPYTEDCRTGTYPPTGPTFKGNVSWYTVNLDLPPEQRWNEVIKAKEKEIGNLVQALKGVIEAFDPTGLAVDLMDYQLPVLLDFLPYPFNEEIQGIADATGLPVGEVIFYNLMFEISLSCTSIIAEDKKGQMFHARNLDFGLFLGWDIKRSAWILNRAVKQLLLNIDFKRKNKTVFKGVAFAGYVGMLTGIKPKTFTLSLNERGSIDNGIMGIIEWALGAKSSWVGFLMRSVLENATSYSDAKVKLTETKLIGPSYFTLGGKSEASVITRSAEKTVDVWELDVKQGTWYLLETNYDHWMDPFFLDDRRTPAMKCMNRITQKNISLPTLYDVLSTKPVLNKLTVCTSMMRVDEGTLETYLRDCPNPCMPW